MDEPIAYLNGTWMPQSSASVSLVDTGFVQGVCVAEQLRTFGGRLFRLEEHLDRLDHSLGLIGVEPGLSRPQWIDLCRQIVAHNHRLLDEGDDLGLSVFVTPGLYPGYSPAGRAEPTVCLHTYPLQFRLWAAQYERGQHLVTSDVCQVPGRCWPAELKCRSRMHYYLADRRAAASDPEARALLLDEQGFVSETSTANVLVYRSEQGLVGPPLEKILHGISLAMAAELAGRLGIAVSQDDLRPDDLAVADEVLLTSTPLCVLPVTRIDTAPIGGGVPGPLFHRLLAAWSELVGLDIAAQARRFAAR